MDFSDNREHESIREAIGRICANFGDDYWLQRDREGGFPHELYNALAAGGWLGICMPTEYGGSGMGYLAHLVAVLRDSRDEFIVVAFDRRGGETQVFKRQEMLAATEEILGDNGVRAQGSPDLLEVWNAKPAQ